MKELLAALANFAENPDAVGDNLFTFFGTITTMDWSDALAAATAIHTLKTNAYNKANKDKPAGEEHKFDALHDPTYTRLESCLQPAIARIGQLLAEAPKEQQKMLLASIVAVRGLLTMNVRDAWAKALEIDLK